MSISTKAFELAALTQLLTTGGPLKTQTLVLFTGPPTVSKTTVFADLTIATFDGYANVAALAYGTPFVDVDGLVKTTPPSVQFTCTGATVSEVILGWAVVNAGLTAIQLLQILPVPVPISEAGDGLIVQPTYTYGE